MSKHSFFSILLALAALTLSSCTRLGWGILLWSTEEPPILSGTILPVYIKSNIDQVWVVGVPETLRKDKKVPGKIEIPLTQLEFVGSKRKAIKWAQDFSYYAPVYAENLQDGLPIRDDTDNNSRRVYRLRAGEIIKVLDKVDGNPPISTTGDPLPGEWYKVLTHDGVIGYCFSYRLKIFDHNEGPLQATNVTRRESMPDPELDMVMSKTWSPESYLQMINSRQINIRELEKHYRFDPGQDTGIARIVLADLEKEFVYEGIYPDGERTWRFEGTDLQIDLRSNTTLAVQFLEGSGLKRTIVFVALSADVDDLIQQENSRREAQYMTIFNQGPVFTSNNYGTIILTESGGFKWTGYDLLVPQVISAETKGEGRAYMDLFLAPSFAERYNGAITLRFSDLRSNNILRFMYTIDSQGLRLELVPEYAVEDITITRRSSSPMVLYFFRDSQI